ncbi:MAG: 16S rRNA (cytidine(1402)-2'-O)-methyltransferase [Candidatus Nanopelagicales bacterium]|nr:16S rRNA (cytidine(1402)-2'-O)-methyltransferase [Candidatus Nanopelagicales bacterium]MDZ4249581.1 16S rRNA (cytidine(1402)-2'-O)-methyltransferase [Candidatus Nanopelagicales bacterium]
MTGILTLAATPIGNPHDASARLSEVLAAAPVIAAEDTRRLHRLAGDIGIRLRGRVISLFEGNEARRTAEVLELLAEGTDVVLVSDAGMPTVSDPGHRLVAAAALAGITVRVLPGPSAVTAALAMSGLPTDRFCFEGFLPRKGAERARRINELRTESRTAVLFESPRRTASTLADLSEALGPGRRAVVCRELTKTHEEIRRGTLAELGEWAREGVLGEVVLVIAGSSDQAAKGSPSQWAHAVEALVADGLTRRDAVAQVCQMYAVPRRQVYEAAHPSPKPSR